MDQGQELFLSYILERVQEDKVEEAKQLLALGFQKLAEGNFTQEDIVELIPKMISILKPDKIEEVQEVVKQFAGNLGNQ
jgi:hypothetical protein